MKALLFFIFFVLTAQLHAQSSMDVHVANLSGRYNFQDLDAFATSYNSFYANDPDLITPLIIKKMATGFQFGATLNYERWLNASIDIGNVRTGISKAEWGAGFDRGIQLRSFLFDMDAGFYVVPDDSPIRVSVGLGFSLQSTQIQSFLAYGDERSYGGESLLNGVWSSWKGYTPLVIKLSYLSPNDHWKFFANAKLPIQKKKVNSVGFTYSSGFTTAGQVFPADLFGNWEFANRLSENYRFINLAIGIAYQFPLQ